jgi:hypothetical protein
VPLLPGGNWIGQFPYGQGTAAAATNATTTTAAVGEEQNTTGDQGEFSKKLEASLFKKYRFNNGGGVVDNNGDSNRN